MLNRAWLVLVILLFVSGAQAADVYPFANTSQRQQFHYLTHQFRCLVCQNEDLAASNASLAQDLRADIYRMVMAKQSNQQIIQYMVHRYGAFVLFKPPVIRQTWLLWFLPLLLLLLGFWVVLRVVQNAARSRRVKSC